MLSAIFGCLRSYAIRRPLPPALRRPPRTAQLDVTARKVAHTHAHKTPHLSTHPSIYCVRTPKTPLAIVSTQNKSSAPKREGEHGANAPPLDARAAEIAGFGSIEPGAAVGEKADATASAGSAMNTTAFMSTGDRGTNHWHERAPSVFR